MRRQTGAEVVEMPRPGPGDRQKIALSHYAAIAPRIEREVPQGARMALWRELAREHGVTRCVTIR